MILVYSINLHLLVTKTSSSTTRWSGYIKLIIVEIRSHVIVDIIEFTFAEWTFSLQEDKNMKNKHHKNDPCHNHQMDGHKLMVDLSYSYYFRIMNDQFMCYLLKKLHQIIFGRLIIRPLID